MATMIEIPMTKFNALGSEINALKAENAKLAEENKKLKENLYKTTEELEEIKHLQFFERLFHWGKTVN